MSLSNMDIEKRMKRFVDLCRERGIRVTHQRLEIFRELAQTETHPSADILFERLRRRLPTVSLDTIYRTLNLFDEKGIITKVGTTDHQTRFDANTDQHHHFFCKTCGRIQDFTCQAFNDLNAPPEAMSVGDVTTIRVEIQGICSACREAPKKTS